jgi:hypothetical protein
VTSGGAVFTNVSGQSAYGWSAAAGDMPTLLGGAGALRFVAGDRLFVSSDHSETQTAGSTYGSGVSGSAGFVGGQALSVNRAGSVPPVTADLAAGATVTVSAGNIIFEAAFPIYQFGINYIYTGTTASSFLFGSVSTATKTLLFDTCQLYINSATANLRMSAGQPVTVYLYNSTLRFGATTHGIGTATGLYEIIWLNTPSSIAGANIPATLFNSGVYPFLVTARGVDFSAITGTLVAAAVGTGSKYLFDGCRIASSVTRLSTAGMNNTRDLVELINCYDGTSILNEKYTPAGTVTTERTITLAGGATDDVGIFAHKLVSGTNIDKVVQPLEGFWMDIENQTIGSSKTATVEIISSAALNNDELSLFLEYQGTASSPVASFVSTGPGSVLGTPSALPTSTATWNSSPATPVKQQLAVTFTPQLAGRVRGQVRLGKASTTVYYNPVITIS